jgi:predicted metal-binding membrane protein
MTAPAVVGGRTTGLGLSRSTVAAVSAAALLWAIVIAIARDMGNGVGTMDLSFPAFVGMWALMMTAMMLPGVAPVASLYVRTIPAERRGGWLLFVAGYLVVWTAVGVPVFAVLRVLDRTADDGGSIRVVAVAVLAAAGAYQLTPIKRVCLRHCRSPLGQLLHYGNVRGPAKELKVAVHHASFCLGCCWLLMALFVAFGVMNVWVMVGLAAVVVGEKLLPRGEPLGRVAGVAFLALAVAVGVSSRVADRLLPDAPMRSMATEPMETMD